jgi:hypothetical protein
MKRVFSSILLIFGLTAFSFAQVQIESGAQIKFEKDVHDFGNLKQGGDATTEFTFTNTGNEPLIISNSQGSCGCTVPSWPREPIAPGKSASIKVKYDSQRLGPINKSVTVTSNATNEPNVVLRIKGVIEPPVQGTPVKENSPMTPKAN